MKYIISTGVILVVLSFNLTVKGSIQLASPLSPFVMILIKFLVIYVLLSLCSLFILVLQQALSFHIWFDCNSVVLFKYFLFLAYLQFQSLYLFIRYLLFPRSF